MNKNVLNISKEYRMFNQILIANTGYTNGKKIHTINCDNLSQSDINYEYTSIVLTDKIELPYELIGKEGQQIKPCFDCDPKIDKNGEIDILKTIQEGIKEVDKLYPDNTKYVYYRIYDTDDNKVKISSHIIVDGIRTNSKTILHKLESNNYKKMNLLTILFTVLIVDYILVLQIKRKKITVYFILNRLFLSVLKLVRNLNGLILI